MLLQKIWFGNVSEVYEVKVPEFAITSRVDVSIANGKGGVVLDWSDYDITDKYFVIYRKEEGQEDFEIIVRLEEKFNGKSFVDSLGNDKEGPNKPNINVIGSEENNIEINVNSKDNGTKHIYYVEAYDVNNLLMAISNKVVL